MADIHNRKDKIKNTRNKLQDHFSDHNTELLKQFADDLSSHDISIDRVCRYLSSFNTLSTIIDFKLDEADKDQLKTVVAKINRGEIDRQDGRKDNFSPWTLAEFKKAIKKFYVWQTGESDPDIVDFVTVNVKTKNKKELDPDKLLEPKHVKELVQAAGHKRDKSLIFLLWETGARIQELLSVSWGDIRFNEDMTKIKITESKSMQRSVYIKEAVPVLKDWREAHPRSDEPDAPVFTRLRSSNHGQDRLEYNGAYSVIKKTVKKTDIPSHKMVNPHAFRKARATYLASEGWNAAQLCQQFGWNDFKTARSYIKLAKQDLKEQVKQMHGLDEDGIEAEDDDSLETVRCQECRSVNAGTDTHCRECEAVLPSAEKLYLESQKQELEREVADELITELVGEVTESEEEAEAKKEELISQAVEKKLEDQGLM